MNKYTWEIAKLLKGSKTITIKPYLGCNFKCPYCIMDRSNPKWRSRQKITVKKWIKIIDKSSPAVVNISGGEPLLYPELDKLIAELIKRKYLISMVSNMSLYRKLPVSWRFIIHASYHPTEIQEDVFLFWRQQYIIAGHKVFTYQVGHSTLQGAIVQPEMKGDEKQDYIAFNSVGEEFLNCYLNNKI